MPASGTTNSVTSFNAVALIPRIDTGSESGQSGPKWLSPSVILRSGNKPSEASIHIQLTDDTGEKNPVVSCQEFPKGTHVTIKTQGGNESGAVVFSGYIVVQDRQISGGMVRLTALDARWIMDGVILTGALVYSEGNGPIYAPATPLVCNEKGLPNCCFQGGITVFCQPNFGLGENETPVVAEGKAGFWTPNLLFGYFRYMATTAAAKAKINAAGVYGLAQLDTEQLEWPETLGQDIPSNAFIDEQSFEGMTLTSALSKLCEQLGYFGLYVSPAASLPDQLRIVSTRYGAETNGGGTPGYALNLALRERGTIGSGIFVNGGSTQISAADAYTTSFINGAPVEIERRTDNPESELFTEMIPAWTQTQENGWRAFIKKQLSNNADLTPGAGAGNPSAAVSAAWTKFPYVFAAYKINPEWDFTEDIADLAGTVQAHTVRPPLARLLTMQAPATDSNAAPFAVAFETHQPGSGNPGLWRPVQQNTGFRVDESGLIWLDGMRGDAQPGGNWEMATWNGAIDYDGTNYAALAASVDAIVGVDIRATFVLRADTRLYKAVSSGDAAGAPGYMAPGAENNTGGWAPGITRTKYQDAGTKYQLQIAKDSYPVPQSVQDSVRNKTLQDNSAPLLIATKQTADDAFRFGMTANLSIPHIIATIRPGQQVKDLIGETGRATVRGVVYEVRLTATPGSNSTELACQ